MPELTTSQIDSLHHDLLTLRDELCKLMEDSSDGVRPVSLDAPIGRLSRMDAMQQQSMTQANRRTAHRRLERVEAALRRHTAGSYGFCQDCEEPIGYARLKARPEAPFCIDCQTNKEARG